MNTTQNNKSDIWIHRVWPYFLLLIPPLCWGANVVLARGVIDIIAPVSFAFWRWALAFLILLPFARRHAARDWPVVVRHWKMLVFLSLSGITCFNTLLYMGVHTTTAINGALIQTSMPALIILISLVAFKEKVTPIQVIGVCLCIFGAGLVVLRGKFSALLSMSFVEGDIFIVVASVLYAIYSAYLRKRPGIHQLSFLLYTFGIGAVGLLPLYVLELSYRGSSGFSQDAFLSVLFVAVFPSLVAYFCWNRGVALVGANRAGLYVNFVPVFASIMAVVWLGESLMTFHVVGMVLICGGMILFNR